MAKKNFFKGGNFQVFNLIFKGAIFNFSFQNHIKVKIGGKIQEFRIQERAKKNEEWETRRMKKPAIR